MKPTTIEQRIIRIIAIAKQSTIKIIKKEISKFKRDLKRRTLVKLKNGI